MQLTAIAAVKRFEAESEASVAFGLCCHSNETAEPIVNPPNSAQLGGAPLPFPKVTVVWACGEGQTHTYTHTDGRDHYTFRVVYDSREM